MNAPDKIYIAETPNKIIEIWSDEPAEPKPYITEHEYIRKDALLVFLNERRKGLSSGDSFVAGERKMLKEIIEKIKSL